PAGSVRAAAESAVRAQLRGASYEIHLQAAEPDARLHLARCPQALTAALPGSTLLGAHVAVRVSCDSGHARWAIFVPVNIEASVPVLVLRQTQIRGARLKPADVTTEIRRVPGVGAAYLSDPGSLARRTLARNLPAGTALSADQFDADFLVRQGQSVTLVAALPGIEVRAPGRVLEDAREGAHVHVQNLASQRVVLGVVDASGLIYATP
ncbi:MAG TPA: flagellar basal body P-ring formation chaperone FlgA, partial [Steroidobacteraceae bacterium]|nr:flagellar basal body P-ring formation chaperone FlgA [Steroidobacteraceae bacterium]